MIWKCDSCSPVDAFGESSFEKLHFPIHFRWVSELKKFATYLLPCRWVCFWLIFDKKKPRNWWRKGTDPQSPLCKRAVEKVCENWNISFVEVSLAQNHFQNALFAHNHWHLWKWRCCLLTGSWASRSELSRFCVHEKIIESRKKLMVTATILKRRWKQTTHLMVSVLLVLARAGVFCSNSTQILPSCLACIKRHTHLSNIAWKVNPRRYQKNQPRREFFRIVCSQLRTEWAETRCGGVGGCGCAPTSAGGSWTSWNAPSRRRTTQTSLCARHSLSDSVWLKPGCRYVLVRGLSWQNNFAPKALRLDSWIKSFKNCRFTLNCRGRSARDTYRVNRQNHSASSSAHETLPCRRLDSADKFVPLQISHCFDRQNMFYLGIQFTLCYRKIIGFRLLNQVSISLIWLDKQRTWHLWMRECSSLSKMLQLLNRSEIEEHQRFGLCPFRRGGGWRTSKTCSTCRFLFSIKSTIVFQSTSQLVWECETKKKKNCVIFFSQKKKQFVARNCSCLTFILFVCLNCYLFMVSCFTSPLVHPQMWMGCACFLSTKRWRSGCTPRCWPAETS